MKISNYILPLIIIFSLLNVECASSKRNYEIINPKNYTNYSLIDNVLGGKEIVEGTNPKTREVGFFIFVKKISESKSINLETAKIDSDLEVMNIIIKNILGKTNNSSLLQFKMEGLIPIEEFSGTIKIKNKKLFLFVRNYFISKENYEKVKVQLEKYK